MSSPTLSDPMTEPTAKAAPPAEASERGDAPAARAAGSPGEPSDNQRRAREGQAAIKRLSAPVRGRILAGQILAVASGLLSIAPYVALVRLGDLLLNARATGAPVDSAAAWSAVRLLIGAYTGRLGLYFIALLITHAADLSLRDHLRRAIVGRLAAAPLSWFTASSSGALRKTVQDDTRTVHTVIAHGPIDYINALVTPVCLLIYAFTIDWRLGLLSVSTIPLYVGTYALTMRGMKEKTVEMDRRLAEISATMVEFVAGISVVKAFGRVGRAHGAYIAAADRFSSFYRDWALPMTTTACASYIWVSIPVLLVVNLGGGWMLVDAGEVTPAQALTCVLIALVLPASMVTIVSISWSYQIAGASALRLVDVLDTPVLAPGGSGARGGVRSDDGARVEIDHVSYSYGQTLAVDDASLTLEPGTVTALLGPSGSGKSTLATLIARFADPDSGAVRIGGADLRDMSESELFGAVSFVLQDAQLLRASIRDNIALARPDATDEQVRAAAAAARIDTVIESLPHGYDTILGEETSLSGGQEQRLAIARALLKDSPILLLDEATAMADPESEDEIQQALSVLVRGRTVLVIAHRPAAFRGAHRIAIMERGRIVASGTHEELIGEPHYEALLRQTSAEGTDDGEDGGSAESTARAGDVPSAEVTAARVPAAEPADAAGPADSTESAGSVGSAGPGEPAESAQPAEPQPVLGAARGRSILASYRRLMTPESWRILRKSLTLGALAGAVSGLALVALLPSSVALASGEPCWGLGLGGWLAVLGLCGVVASALDFAGQRNGVVGILGFLHDAHHAIGARIARLPLSWFTGESAGSLSRAMTQEMVDLSDAALQFLYKISGSVASIAVVWAASWAWDWRLGVVLTVAMPVLALILRWARAALDHGKRLSEPAERELAARIVEFARCQGALRSARAGADYPQLRRAFQAADAAGRRTLWWETCGGIMSGALTQIIIVAMIALSARLALGGSLGPLEAVATIGMCLRFTTMLDDLGSQALAVEERRRLMAHLDEVMEAPVLPEPDASAALTAPSEVVLDDVVFGYRQGAPVLRGVSMRVPARSMCALVGPSGSGKTTIARLIARFYDVDSGSVRVGGVGVRELTTADLMAQVSLVFQDVYLFDDTLEANIAIGDPDADAQRLQWAADLAGVTEIAERLPGGWQARVGEGGRALSGGERQRVSIARALLKRAPIVLFDEATSALDAENEAHIVAAMQELRRASTLIVIAHKLETIAAADQVVVLGRNGRVAQRGTHDELVALPGQYRDFWECRSRARGWELV